MDQDFKFKFDEMLDNKPQAYDGNTGKGDAKSIEYAGPGNIRDIILVWPHKDMFALNYSYLVAIKYRHSENIISLLFTTHTVRLKGVRLEELAYALVQQIPRIIECVDERYNVLENRKPIVNQIEVIDHKK